MDKLYYGNGNCTIEGSDIRGVEIRYTGAIEIEDKTSDSFVIAHQNNGIMIFPIWEGTLNELFNYTGEFKITSVIVAGLNAEKVQTTIHRVMDYTELLNTNAEDMTTNSENLSSTHVSGRRVAKTSLKQPYIPNLHTSRHDGDLYLKDGTSYSGDFHIHVSDNSAMTGKEHTEHSQDLFYENGKPTKNPQLVPYGAIKQNKERKIQQSKSRIAKTQRITSNRSNY